MNPKYKKCPKCDNDFSCFFLHASKEEKKRIMLEVAKEAWEEQRKVMEKANNMIQ